MKFPHVQLIERSQMQMILKEHGFQKSGCTNDQCAVEVGQLLGVKNMVVGSVGKAGSYTVLSVRVLDVGSGSVVVTESIKEKGGIDKILENGIKSASAKLVSYFLPENAEQKPEKSPEVKQKKLGKAIFIGSGAAILVGGGVVAAVLLSRGESNEPAITPNTKIVLP